MKEFLLKDGMKGLLLKDWYMMKKYCKTYFVIAAVFIVLSFIGDNNMFFVFYPCLLCGMIPISLLSYDERSHWLQYSCTMPYTKEQIVSSKYLIGLLAQIVTLLIIGVVQGTKMVIQGNIEFSDFTILMLLILIVVTLTSSMSLPFIFKMGVEKGRIACYVMIGFVCGSSVLASNVIGIQMQMDIQLNLILLILALLGIGIYALSWYLSIIFYKRREL